MAGSQFHLGIVILRYSGLTKPVNRTEIDNFMHGKVITEKTFFLTTNWEKEERHVKKESCIGWGFVRNFFVEAVANASLSNQLYFLSTTYKSKAEDVKISEEKTWKILCCFFDQALSLLLGTTSKSLLWACLWWNTNKSGNKLLAQNWECNCCDRKDRAESAQSFTLWRQTTIEITCRDHCIIACSRHIYMGVILRAHPVRGESHIQRNANGEVATQLMQVASCGIGPPWKTWIFSSLH